VRNEHIHRREVTALLLALEELLSEDRHEAESALASARVTEHAVMLDDLWKGGRHSGDCTNEPHTCFRCLYEDAQARARKMIHEADKE